MTTIGNSILGEYGTTIFSVMNALATRHGAINLGQGAPDEDGPEEVRQVAARTLLERSNQYAPLMGLPELRQAVALHNGRFHGLDVDWETETLVTIGATEALASAILGLVEPGNEVVLIEPLYDSYLPLVRRAGGVPRLVRMEPPEWELPLEALTRAFSDRTKLLILNSPHNPSGKVFEREELEIMAELLLRHDAYAVCDEVYEHLVYDDAVHVPLMTLPGMRDRCLRIGSAGKTFSVTGWKVGYVTAAPRLLEPVTKAHQFLTFTVPPNLQVATAHGLCMELDYFRDLAEGLRAKRDRLASGLGTVGFDVLPSRGTYFLTADFRPLGFNGSDTEFCRHITTEAGVTAVPVSAFYQDKAVDHFARFCFCKRDTMMDEALERLLRHFA